MKKRNIVTLAVSLTAGVIFTVFLALLIFGRTVFACSSSFSAQILTTGFRMRLL